MTLTRHTPLAARTPLRTHTGLQAQGSWSRSVPLLSGSKSAATGGTGRKAGLAKWVPPQPAGVDPARKSAARRRPETGFSRSTKLKVRTRAGNGSADDAICESCGFWLGRRHGQVQHRVARGAGGCTDEVINGPANAALLCGTPHVGCHGRATAFEEDMGPDDKGFWLKHGTTWEYDPRNAPIKLASEHGSGLLVYLAEDGLGPDGTGYLLQAPKDVAA